MTRAPQSMRVIAWGTYDTGKPRVRILLRGLRENGVTVIECHREVWSNIEDKSQVQGLLTRARLALRWLLAFPPMILCYLRAAPHDAVLVPYLGQLDVLVLWPFAKLRRKRVILDAFLSLYNTVVEDRRLIGKSNPIAWLLFAWEWLALHAADAVIVDTEAHAAYFCRTFRLSPHRVHRVLVGVEPERFPVGAPLPPKAPGEPFRVLFYGQFIPLHGIDTVVRAAKLSEAHNIEWHLIGTGQEREATAKLIADLQPSNVTWSPWLPYDQLIDAIHAADVCLGIFGATDKAARVIPNKVFQVLAAGRPVITRDGPAARELLTDSAYSVLIPPADPAALAAAVLAFRQAPTIATPPALPLLPVQVVQPLVDLLQQPQRI